MNFRRTVANSLSTVLDRYSPERLFLLPFHLENAHPAVFIVGVPRSGTTIVYQHLVNKFHFSYFSNISKRLSPFAIPSAVLGRYLFSYEPTQSSRFGITDGAMGPSDGWGIFHRWFPRNGLSAHGTVRGIHELKNIVRIYEKLFDAPFINKNNANALRIRELAGLFPDAVFVHVHRSPMQTVFSLLDARRKQNIGADEWWGPTPPDLVHAQFKSEEARVVRQVAGLENTIRDSLKAVPESHRISVSYEDFCQDPSRLCERIETFYRNCGYVLRTRPCDVPELYHASSREALYDDTAIQLIQRELDAVDDVDGSGGTTPAKGS
jgi:hypothetical protein